MPDLLTRLLNKCASFAVAPTAVIASAAKQSRGAYQISAPLASDGCGENYFALLAFNRHGKPPSLQDLIRRSFSNRRTGLLRYARNDDVLAVSSLSPHPSIE